MSKIVFILVCVAFLQIASALQCYQCDKDLCQQDQKQWKTIGCGAAISPTLENLCLKVTYKETGSGKELTERKCAINEKGKNYECDTPANGNGASCELCKTHLCNSAPSVSFNVVALSGMILAALIPKYLL